MLEGSRNLLLATEDSTVVHSSRFLDGKINVEIQDLSGSVHLYPRRRRLNDAIEVTTVLNNVSVTQGYNAETSINVAVASVDPLTSLVLQLNNASVAVTTATIDSETIVEQAAPAEQPATVADTITANPITSNVAGSRITLSWTAPVDGGSAIVGYAVWYNATHKQVSIQVLHLMVLFSFAHLWNVLLIFASFFFPNRLKTHNQRYQQPSSCRYWVKQRILSQCRRSMVLV